MMSDPLDQRTSVGFIGLGNMGLPMAHNLLSAGFEMNVFNRTQGKCDQLREAGAVVGASPSEVASRADVLLTMLSDGDAVEAAMSGPHGILAGARARDRERPLVWIDMSTIGPARARELALRAAAEDVHWLDAPVSGGVSLAEAGQLYVMVGGDAVDFERVAPVLGVLGKGCVLLGPPGAGAAMKLALNILIASTTHAISESLVLAECSGIERKAAYDVIIESAVASPFVAYKRAAFLDPEREPVAFSLDLMRKDLDLAIEQGEAFGVPMLSAASSTKVIEMAAELRGGQNDLVRVADALRATVTESNQNGQDKTGPPPVPDRGTESRTEDVHGG